MLPHPRPPLPPAQLLRLSGLAHGGDGDGEDQDRGLWSWFLPIFLMARGKTGLLIICFSKLCGISYKRVWLMARRVCVATEK